MVATPDVVESHTPGACHNCGHAFTHGDEVTKVERRQVRDLPAELRLIITEHQIETRRCGDCGKTTKADGPTHALGPAQYGPHVAALITYLVASKYLSSERTADLLTDLFAAPISTGTVTKIATKAAILVDAHYKPVAKKALKREPIAHADETTLNVAGGTRWVHTFSSPRWTWIESAKKRGREAMDTIGILPAFTGILVTDAWGSYDIYGSEHQLCCAHLLRELAAVHQNHQHHDNGLFRFWGVVAGWVWSARRCRGGGRGLPMMEVLVPSIWKTSTCLTLPSVRLILMRS
jgi:transposase